LKVKTGGLSNTTAIKAAGKNLYLIKIQMTFRRKHAILRKFNTLNLNRNALHFFEKATSGMRTCVQVSALKICYIVYPALIFF
jgi:hypothetical protein